MNKILVVLALALALTGCAIPDWDSSYMNFYVATEGENDLYFMSGTRPYAVITNYENTFYMPLLKDENLYGTWMLSDDTQFLTLKRDATVLVNNPVNGAFEGTYQWITYQAIVIRYTKLNGELLAEPFDQTVIFKEIDSCTYEMFIYTFGYEQTGIVHKCELEGA